MKFIGKPEVVDTDTNTQLSNAEVRTAVEAATDSNVFTDADHNNANNANDGLWNTSRLLSSQVTPGPNTTGLLERLYNACTLA